MMKMRPSSTEKTIKLIVITAKRFMFNVTNYKAYMQLFFSKIVVGVGFLIPINTTIWNYGTFFEGFNLTTHSNEIVIDTFNNINLLRTRQLHKSNLKHFSVQ